MNREAEEFRISSDIKQANLELAVSLLDEVSAGWLVEATDLNERVKSFLASQQGEQCISDTGSCGVGGYCAECPSKHPEQAEAAQGELDERMRAAGMFTVAEMLKGTPLDAFTKHAGVCDMDTFGQWLEMKRAEYLKMQARYDLGERDKSDDLYEWVIAHLAVFTEAHVNFRAALAQPSPAPELEQPEVVAFLMKPDTYEPYVGLRRDGTCDCVEPLMTVAQHERIVESLQAEVLSWRETVRFNESCWAEERGVMIDKIQTIRGGIPLAIAAIEDGAVMITGIEDRLFKALSEHTHWKRKTASLELYAAPVAQAGQVPEGYMVLQSASLSHVLGLVEGAMEDAYGNAFQVCCGKGRGGECCGDPEAGWSPEDQRTMDVLHPIQRELRAMLDATPAQGDGSHE